MNNWIDYWRAVRGRITWDHTLLRGAWVVPWLQLSARIGRSAQSGTIAYHPQPAGPWYTMPLALAGSRLRRTRDLSRADVIMMFDDRSRSDNTLPEGLEIDSKRLLNYRATDITKTHVGQIFKASFGYAMSVDPLTHTGSMVEKSDDNGVHDGRIIEGPLPAARSGCVYQRLVDSTVRPSVTEELRCICVGGQIVQLFRKEKAQADRFTTRYLKTTLHEGEEWLSPQERQQIAVFCDAMGLDFGSIDVLRDHAGDRRIYIVDVNKTCMPVLSMPVTKLRPALNKIGRAVEALVFGPDVQSQAVASELEGIGFVTGQIDKL